MMNELALFSGIAGLSTGINVADPTIRTVCHVEIDRYAAAVLMSRMRSGDIPFAPIWDDVRTFDGRPWCGVVDIISGGFPCQDISVSGKRAGINEGTRSGLWFEFKRIIGEVRPAIAFVENVANLLSIDNGRGFGTVLGDLADLGYNAEWGCVSAEDAGAPHLRKRIFIMGYSQFCRFDRFHRGGAGPISKDGCR
jgi:DNA (cytosine-5)-methyltransferase 1